MPTDPSRRSYANYLTANSQQHTRQPSDAPSTAFRNSGVGGIGMGLLAMDSDSDGDMYDEEASHRWPEPEARRGTPKATLPHPQTHVGTARRLARNSNHRENPLLADLASSLTHNCCSASWVP